MITLNRYQLPLLLQNLPQPPEKLYVSGDSLQKLLDSPRIAIVGSRKVTPYGRTVTHKLSHDLASKGMTIVSGLALGVDSIAHTSCLEASGTTIAVLPAGLDKIYPSSHHNLAQDIIRKNGLLVSEYPPNTPPLRHNFIARNRIIAALAEGLLITEAAIASGSLHTARFALELGIPVFAVPGPITSPASAGTNNLIKAGATPVTGIDDIINAMNWQQLDKAPKISADNPEGQIIIDLITSGIVDGHELHRQSQLDITTYNRTMTMLELTGKVRPVGANHWMLN
ncbi:DNA-processing protein DprA [Candidatus Saccharibacteria bacterium]|nr:DNA-processing protein DprA [Candidatus Saccharibacteria bacterium]